MHIQFLGFVFPPISAFQHSMVKSATSPSHGHAAYETVKHSKCTELCPVKLMVWKQRPEWTNIHQPTTRDGWCADREHFSIRFQITMVVISAAVFTTYLLTNRPALTYVLTIYMHLLVFTFSPTYLHTGPSLYTIGYDSESWHQLSLGSSIHNCVIRGFQWMVHWWLLVCSGPLVICIGSSWTVSNV
jgi:hypothetical protein